MIELQNVTKYFRTPQGKHYILKNSTFSIPSDVNIGILGRNGAGKSTLMKMLGKIEFPNEGKIISDKSFSWVMGVGGGFQNNMTGRANVKFVCRIYGKSKAEIDRSIAFVKEFSELGDYFEMPIKTYSSGMKSRLTFGLSLAFDFDYLLIDETLSVGDARFRKKSKEALMKKIESCNVLLVSHDMGTLRDICDVGIVSHNAKLHYFDDIKDAIEMYQDINKKG
jgi:capsular polysaccharide transport system ATP-binding protein